MRIGSLILFAAIVLAIAAAWHRYLWLRLVRDPGWPAPYGRIATIVLALLLLSIPGALVLGRSLPHPVGRALSATAFNWLGFAFLLFVVLLVGDAFFAVARALAPSAAGAPDDPARRRLLARGFAAIACAVTSILTSAAVRAALARVETRVVRVVLPKLPAAMNGFSIVQLSDIHVGPTIGRSFVEEVVEHVNREQPDLIAITGDLVDGSVRDLLRDVEPLSRLRARHGVYFVTGNHEYYSGAGEWVAALEGLGVRVLQNEQVPIGDARCGFDLAGVNDASAARFGEGHGPNYAKACAQSDPGRALVLLAHAPRQIHEAARAGVGLQISGHTHGGQIWPFGLLVRLTEPYLAGLHRHTEETQIYVSRGTGYWGPAMRLGAPSEVTKIVLEAPS